MRIGKPQSRDHEDLVDESGFNSVSHYNLVHKPVPILQAITIPDAKAAVDREWEKLEKFPAGQVTQVQSKKEVIGKAQKEGRTVHLATLMDFCHLKNSDLQPKFQKYKRRVVLRGDAMKDDSCSYASFTEQGSSASQITAAKVLDVIARLPGCAGASIDAVSANTQVKMEDAPTQLKLPKSECLGIWIRLLRYTWPRRLGRALKNQRFL